MSQPEKKIEPDDNCDKVVVSTSFLSTAVKVTPHENHAPVNYHKQLELQQQKQYLSSSNKRARHSGLSSDAQSLETEATNVTFGAKRLFRDSGCGGTSNRHSLHSIVHPQQSENNNDTNDASFDHNASSQQTQTQFSYTQSSQADEQSFETHFLVVHQDEDRRNGAGATIGLDWEESAKANDNTDGSHLFANLNRDLLPNKSVVGRDHARLHLNKLTKEITLQARRNKVWIRNNDTRKWKVLDPGNSTRLDIGQSIRVAPPGKNCPLKNVQYYLATCQTNHAIAAGSESFDDEYIKLLRLIKTNGSLQSNNKGKNWTASQQVTLKVDLRSPEDLNLLPLTTLRQIFVRANLVEALWYLRGEESIEFLQRNNCKFWDGQARDGKFVGLNYGLLTNFPQKEDGTTVNQLIERVIEPLCQGKCSRNMLCTLSKPGEQTEQEACTSSVQFSVSSGDILDLTVNQRSSDVILGLPNDVVVWSIILHLVRREVNLKSQRRLKAGTLYFSIASGGAHVYCLNQTIFDELLQRTPISGVKPHLKILTDQRLFELAEKYGPESQNMWAVEGYDSSNCYHPKMKIAQAL